MRRDELEMYLDGELSPERRIAVEQAVADDAEVRRMLERLRGERQLRESALAGYAPPPTEAAAFAAHCITMLREAGDRPLARIGMGRWLRHGSAVAAALLLAAGTYWMGLTQNHAAGSQGTAVTTRYVAVVPSSNGVLAEREFATLDEARAYAQQVQQDSDSNTQVAAYDSYGSGVF